MSEMIYLRFEGMLGIRTQFWSIYFIFTRVSIMEMWPEFEFIFDRVVSMD